VRRYGVVVVGIAVVGTGMTDKNWLKQQLPDATEAEIEAFCERVAIKWADGVSIEDARGQALVGILTDRKKMESC